MEEQLSGAGGEIAAEVRNGVATVTLNRPAALNALTLGMVDALARWLDAWEKDDRVRMVVLRGSGEKAFCAGGDIRALDYRIHTYSKTVVAVLDGIVMGGGMGISQGARVRIAGDRTRMAMPETAIGAFPDVGGSYFLSRLPGRLGAYLALVGPSLGPADALYCGLADLCAGAKALQQSELEALRPAIDQHFGEPSLAAIVESLRREDRPRYREWAARAREALAQRSPFMLAVTLEQVKRGATMSLAECFRMELDMVYASFEQRDYLEGIRALIIDKDKNPRWSPAMLDDVSPDAVQAFFAPRWLPAQHPLATLR